MTTDEKINAALRALELLDDHNRTSIGGEARTTWSAKDLEKFILYWIAVFEELDK